MFIVIQCQYYSVYFPNLDIYGVGGGLTAEPTSEMN